MPHYTIFQRSDAHCVTSLLCAPSLREAMATYYVQQSQNAERLEDGSIRIGDSYTQCGKITYTHPLECIESMEKADGWNGNSWEIQEVRGNPWAKEFAEIHVSADPDDVKTYIEVCRPFFRKAFPNSRARAFVWYLKAGALVTFHRRKNARRRWPIEVMARYLLPWDLMPWEEPGQVQPWQGTYDDILAQMAV